MCVVLSEQNREEKRRERERARAAKEPGSTVYPNPKMDAISSFISRPYFGLSVREEDREQR